MNIYQEQILEHYENPRNTSSLKQTNSQVKVKNILCGDEIVLQAFIKDNKITAISHTTKGCAIAQASISILSEYAKDKSIDQLRKMEKKDMIRLLGGITLGPNRVKCALLGFEALQKLLIAYKT